MSFERHSAEYKAIEEGRGLRREGIDEERYPQLTAARLFGIRGHRMHTPVEEQLEGARLFQEAAERASANSLYVIRALVSGVIATLEWLLTVSEPRLSGLRSPQMNTPAPTAPSTEFPLPTARSVSPIRTSGTWSSPPTTDYADISASSVPGVRLACRTTSTPTTTFHTNSGRNLSNMSQMRHSSGNARGDNITYANAPVGTTSLATASLPRPLPQPPVPDWRIMHESNSNLSNATLTPVRLGDIRKALHDFAFPRPFVEDEDNTSNNPDDPAMDGWTASEPIAASRRGSTAAHNFVPVHSSLTTGHPSTESLLATSTHVESHALTLNVPPTPSRAALHIAATNEAMPTAKYIANPMALRPVSGTADSHTPSGTVGLHEENTIPLHVTQSDER